MSVKHLVYAAEALVFAAVAVGLWLAGDAAANAVESVGVPPLLAALALFPILGALSTLAERRDVVGAARLWHGVVVNKLELKVIALAGGDEDEGVAESEGDLYDEGVEAEWGG